MVWYPRYYYNEINEKYENVITHDNFNLNKYILTLVILRGMLVNMGKYVRLPSLAYRLLLSYVNIHIPHNHQYEKGTHTQQHTFIPHLKNIIFIRCQSRVCMWCTD